jgi:hypothetical protein
MLYKTINLMEKEKQRVYVVCMDLANPSCKLYATTQNINTHK